jgi:hypothetical protein
VELQCYSHWNRVDLSRVPPGIAWWDEQRRLNVQGGGRRRQAVEFVRWLAAREKSVRERVLVYTHWGTVEAVSGRSCRNGGSMIEFVYAPILSSLPSKKWDWVHVQKRE